MTKKTIVVAGVFFSSLFLAACSPQVSPQSEITPLVATPTPTVEESMNASLKDLVAQGRSVQCSFSFNDDKAKTSSTGTLFASGKKFSQTSQVIMNNGKTPVTQRMNVISDGSFVYTWNPEVKSSGMKISMDTGSAPTPGTAKEAPANLDQKMDMKCTPWTADETKFNVPTDVKFTDLSSMMKGVQNNLKNLPTNIPNMPKY